MTEYYEKIKRIIDIASSTGTYGILKYISVFVYPTKTEEQKKKEQHDRMMELAKEFDRPIPDEVMDELELFSAEWEAASYQNMDRILT